MSRSIVRAPVTLVGLLLALALGACGGASGPSATADVSERVQVGQAPTVVVESDAGSIDIQAGADGVVTVDAKKRAPSKNDLDRINVTVKNDNGTVRITYKAEGDVRGREVDFTIKAPVDALPQVTLTGGTIKIAGLRRGAQASASGGTITLRDVKGALKLRTGGGSIDITGADGAVGAHTEGGSITVAGKLSGQSVIETEGGSIRVTVPAASNLRVDAATDGGSISNEFGLAVEGTDNRTMRGTIGDGSGGTLQLRNGGGSITLSKGS